VLWLPFVLVLSEAVLVLDARMIPDKRFEYEYRRKRLSTSTMVVLPEHHYLLTSFIERSFQKTG